MKKHILYLFLILFSLNAYAQNNAHSISAGYGFWGTSSIIKTDMLAESLKDKELLKDVYSSGVSHISYKYAFETSDFSIGVTYAFELKNGNVFEIIEGGDIATLKSKVGDFDKTYHTVAAEIRYDYYRKKLLSIYAVGGLGVTFQQEKYRPLGSIASEIENRTSYNLQLTPFGIKYGERFIVFGEIGIGYKGLINIGLAVGF